MRLTLTLLFLCSLATISLAQINDESPFPVDFEVLSPVAAAGIYDYGTQTADASGDPPIWGPTLSETVAGEIAWGFGASGDSLGCETITTDLTGKLALIRRGACGFSLKAYNAQEAGAIGCIIVNHYTDPAQNGASLVGMLGGDSIDAVVIPAIFVSRTTGETIVPSIDAGESVQGSFTVKSFYDPISSFSYHTPSSDAIEFGDYQINYVNPNGQDAVDVTVTATITAPSGAMTELTGTSNVAPLADSVIAIDGSFLPTEAGMHTITWSNDQSAETLTSGFDMTDFTYAVDDNNLTLNVGPASDFFTNTANLTYQAGNLSLMDADGAQATHMSFGLANGAEIFTGDAIADQIQIILYDGDADNDNQLDFAAGGGASFNDLTPVALATYTINGTETGDELIYVEWEDLNDGDGIVDLKPDGAYYTTINYDGLLAGLGIAPRFVVTTDLPYLNFPTTPIFLDQLYTGWAGQTVAIRLHLAGFEPPVGTDDIVELDAAKVTLAPNPVSDLLNVNFNLEATADEVQLIMTDVSGKIITSEQYEQVYNQSLQMNMRNLPAGTYFLSIATPEGYRVERVVKQ